MPDVFILQQPNFNNYNMNPRIVQLPAKKLVGVNRPMSYSNNSTAELWRGFMPRRAEISNTISNDLFAVQIYPADFFTSVNPSAPFVKWATKEVSDFSMIPEGMETLVIPEGLYAVFLCKGDMSNAADFFQRLFGVWLPESDYVLDDRPHFELLGPKYQHNSPESEEEIWIPVKLNV